MNKIELRNLLAKEVKQSDMSELVKNLLIEYLDGESEKPVKDKELVVARTPREEYVKPVLVKKRKTRRGNNSKIDWQGCMEKCRKIVHNRSRPIKARRLAKMVGMDTEGGNYTNFQTLLKEDKFMNTFKKSQYLMVFKGGDFEPQPKLAKHEKPMHKSEYNKFRSERVKQLCKRGIGYIDACKMAQNDRMKYKHGGKQEQVAFYEFPKITSVREDLIQILKDILKDLDRRNNSIGLADVGYVLDIASAKQFENFVAEILLKSDQIAKAMDINRKLVYDSKGLRWN